MKTSEASLKSAVAIGVYLRTLVDRQPDLTLAGVARAAGVSANFISRLAGGDTKEPAVQNILPLVRAARGRLEDLMVLMEDGSTERAEQLALDALNAPALTDEERRFIQRLPEEKRRALMETARQMQR